MALRRNHPYHPSRRPAPAYQPLDPRSRELGHVICAEIYRSGCDCEKRGQSPCVEMQRSADAVERFISERASKSPSKAA